MCSLTIFTVKLVIKNWFTPKKNKDDLDPGSVANQGLCIRTKQNNLIEEKRHENCIRIDKIYLQFDFFIGKYII